MRILTLVWMMLVGSYLFSAPNCELYAEGTAARQACELCMKAISYPQGSPLSQKYFDKAMEVDPTFAYAPYEKAVPFLKRGEFQTWKSLIDIAVELEPQAYLPYRGWCLFKFMRDYELALADLEAYMKMSDNQFTPSQDGDHDLRIVIALCKRELGREEEAIRDMEAAISDNKQNHFVGLYDYLHLGVSKLRIKDYQGAIEAFELEIGQYEKLADTYYYLGAAWQGLGNVKSARENYEKSLHLFQGQGYTFDDIYTETLDRVYEAEVILKLIEIENLD
ncbi:MAG: hypothetical protein KDE26_27180 [Bacteroidetes bacterium]|nr:hypothetical protein [Bacteroidota bacterium]